MTSEGQQAVAPHEIHDDAGRGPTTVAAAIWAGTGLLLAGLTRDPPVAAGIDAGAASSALLRFDLPAAGGLLFTDAARPDTAEVRFVAWLPAAVLPDLRDLRALRLRVVSRTGRAQALAVRAASYRDIAARDLAALYARFTPLIDTLLDVALAPGHALRAVADTLAEAMAADEDAAAARGGAFGAFDFVADDVAHGWAWDPRAPAARQLVEIVADDGTVVARAHAEHFRSDLPAAGIGDGNHHFRITLPLSLRDGAARMLSARLADGAGALRGGPHGYRAAPASLAWFDMMPAAETYARAAGLPEAAAAAVLHVHALIDNVQPEAACAAAAALLAAHGESALACVKLGEALLLAQRCADAAHAYARAHALDAACAHACLGLGNCHAVREEWIEAEQAYCAGLASGMPCAPLAARREQARAPAFRQRVRMLLRDGRADEAVASLEAHLCAHPDDEAAGALLDQALDGAAPVDAAGVASAATVALARRLRRFEVLFGAAAERRARSAT